MIKTIGILAHVDAGKTSLSEQILYHTKSIRSRGRVDHKNTFLDNYEIERKRGITVFSKIARFFYNENEYFLVDTPGHIDFSGQMERSLDFLDYAILVVSGVQKVQSHTSTVFKLLKKKHEVYYVLDHNGTTYDHKEGSVQFFYSPDIRFYPVARIRCLSFDLNSLDLA